MSLFSFQDGESPVVEKHLSVQAAAECTGCSVQYLRRLLRHGAPKGRKIGQVDLFVGKAQGSNVGQGSQYGLSLAALRALSLRRH